jgi:hypothetical protein
MTAQKPDLLLHVGMDKTGTSAIQHMLHRARPALLERGLLVPETGTWSDHSHHPFAFAALGMAGHTPADLPPLFDALTAEIARTGAPRVVLSTECLFKLPHRDPDNPLWDHLARVFGHVRVIVYLRRQDAWVESRHRHSIVSGRLFTLDRLSGPNFSDYRRFVDAWAARFGRDNVIVRPYERAQFRGGDIGHDFLATLGLPPEAVALQSERRNETFHHEDLLFLAALLDLGLGKARLDRINDLLLARPRDGRPDQSLLSPAAARALVDRYAAVNAGLARDYMGRADGVLFTDPLPDPATPWTEPALSPAAARATLAFIARHDPGLHGAIAQALREATDPEDDPDEDPGARARALLRSLAGER